MYRIICWCAKDHNTDLTFVVNPTDYVGLHLMSMQRDNWDEILRVLGKCLILKKKTNWWSTERNVTYPVPLNKKVKLKKEENCYK